MNRVVLALAVTAVTTLTGCNDYDGKFVAKKDLKFKHTTMFGNEKTKRLDKGVYKASFKGMASGKVKFSFSGDDKLDVKLKMPDGVELPSGDGSFYLLAEESGQNYDISADLATDFQTSGVINSTESCNYTVYETRCERVCKPDPQPNQPQPGNGGNNNGGRGGNDQPPRNGDRPNNKEVQKDNCSRVCNRVPVTRTGRQDVSYRLNTTTKTLDLTMATPSDGNKVATYKGTDVSTSKSYLNRGICR